LFVLLLAIFLLIPCLFRGDGSSHAMALPHRSLAQATNKVIVVSLSRQWLYAYANGSEVFNTAVMTGRPELGTPTGTYHIFAKRSPTTFYSPFPRGSAEWYPPTHITYALEWKAGGFFSP